MSKDYYSILGIDRNASADDIKKAYRKKAMESHPDRHGGDASKETEFKIINEAYAVLSDAQKKARYDQFGSADSGNFGGGFGGFDFGDINVEDIFSSVFGNMGGFGRSRGRSAHHEGEDIQKEIHVSFRESFSGVKKEIHLTRGHSVKHVMRMVLEMAKNLKNAPLVTDLDMLLVRQEVFLAGCNRQLFVKNAVEKVFLLMNLVRTVEEKRVKKNTSYTVDIPAGIDDGMTLKISEEAHEGKYNSGDLYVTCRVDQTLKMLTRQDVNIITTINISPAEAVLGISKKITFPLIGDREIKIAPGTQHGKKIQLAGDGMPVLGRKGRGDLIITLEILVPGKISKEVARLYADILEIEQN